MTAFETNGIERGTQRLRTFVCVGAWLVGLCLVAQVLVWSLATFTELRFTEVKSADRPLRVVVHDDHQRPQVSAAPRVDAPVVAPGPIRIRSRFDLICRDVVEVTLAVGTLALVVMVLVMTVSVVLAAGSPFGRLDRAVSAWMWGLLLIVLALPAAGALRLPWSDTALRGYDALLQQTQTVSVGESVRILALFLVCLVGVVLASVRHSAGIEALIMADPDRIDTALEAEAANVKATALSGGRAAAALQRLVQTPAPGQPAPMKHPPGSKKQPDRLPLATQVSPGTAPRRLV